MIENPGLLVALQHGDSFFPSGSFAFSWGLETLRNDGLVHGSTDVERFALDQLKPGQHRLAVILTRASEDLPPVGPTTSQQLRTLAEYGCLE